MVVLEGGSGGIGRCKWWYWKVEVVVLEGVSGGIGRCKWWKM